MNTLEPENVSCDDCEQDICNLLEEQSFVCKDTTQCWKSTMREKDGNKSNILDGCIGNPYQAHYVCNESQTVGGHPFHIECCKKEFCNNYRLPRTLTVPEKFPEEFEDSPILEEGKWAILGFGGGILLCIIICCLYKLVRKLMKRQRQRSRGRNINFQARDVSETESHESGVNAESSV